MEVVGARPAGGNKYYLRTSAGEYLYNAVDIANIERMFPHPSERAVPMAYKKFHAWLAAPSGRSNARIIWNGAGRPMVDLDSGEARSEVQPTNPAAPGKGWLVDAARPGAARPAPAAPAAPAARACPRCGRPVRARRNPPQK